MKKKLYHFLLFLASVLTAVEYRMLEGSDPLAAIVMAMAVVSSFVLLFYGGKLQ